MVKIILYSQSALLKKQSGTIWMIDLTSNTQKNKNSSTTPLSSLDILQNHNMTSWTEDILKTSVALKVFWFCLNICLCSALISVT